MNDKRTRVEFIESYWKDGNTDYIWNDNHGELIRCKDCKHKPTGSGVNHDITFPSQDYKCPCRCEDSWYSWMPDDDWFCGNGERKDSAEE